MKRFIVEQNGLVQVEAYRTFIQGNRITRRCLRRNYCFRGLSGQGFTRIILADFFGFMEE